MVRLFAYFFAVLGFLMIFAALSSYMKLSDAGRNNTPFNIKEDLVLGPLSKGLLDRMAVEGTTMDPVQVYVGVQNRILGLAAVGLAMLLVSITLLLRRPRPRPRPA